MTFLISHTPSYTPTHTKQIGKHVEHSVRARVREKSQADGKISNFEQLKFSAQTLCELVLLFSFLCFTQATRKKLRKKCALVLRSLAIHLYRCFFYGRRRVFDVYEKSEIYRYDAISSHQKRQISIFSSSAFALFRLPFIIVISPRALTMGTRHQ